MTKERFKLHAAVYLLLFNNDKILFVKRAGSGFYDGFYSLPAGHLDGDEDAKHALAREMKEELNLDLAIDTIKHIHTLHRKSIETNGGQREYLDLFFCYQIDDNIHPMINEPDKIAELRWCNIHQFPNKIVPYIEFVLGEINKKHTYSQHGW